MTEYIQELKNKMIEVWNKNTEIFELLKSLKGKLEYIQNSLDTFFSIVPPEVILLLLFTALIMILINSVSPKTTRINLTIAVILFGIIYLYIMNLLTGQWKIGRILFISSFLLVPAYLLGIYITTRRFLIKAKFKSTGKSPLFIHDSVQEIHLAYGEFLMNQNNFENDSATFVESIAKLKSKIDSLHNSITQK